MHFFKRKFLIKFNFLVIFFVLFVFECDKEACVHDYTARECIKKNYIFIARKIIV